MEISFAKYILQLWYYFSWTLQFSLKCWFLCQRAGGKKFYNRFLFVLFAII